MSLLGKLKCSFEWHGFHEHQYWFKVNGLRCLKWIGLSNADHSWSFQSNSTLLLFHDCQDKLNTLKDKVDLIEFQSIHWNKKWLASNKDSFQMYPSYSIPVKEAFSWIEIVGKLSLHDQAKFKVVNKSLDQG